ncbi:two-component system, NarL family, response regulator DesR [Streptacidiphilus jiangxiensis]|uniref:Two-component system, NarL family, response regulator DesR n=1 Tax=Streptacidiphilus jiangxiensis TaxID=235985 RepID=A0A1H7KRT5_STRJI|nr:two-component system, NarL family, response regulator DesR [Streptacidiphilus jiangxiensis]
MIRVLIAEDQELVRTALARLVSLEDDITVVAEAADGEETMVLATQVACDVAVLDIDMPGMDGLITAEKLRVAHPEISVLLLTSHGRPGYLRRGVQAGARGFVTKNISGSRLADVIREVHAGGRYLDPEIAADAMFIGECPLGPRELEILRLAEDGRPLASIAHDLALSEGTVRNYMSAAVTKLGVGNRAGAVRYAQSMGWL